MKIILISIKKQVIIIQKIIDQIKDNSPGNVDILIVTGKKLDANFPSFTTNGFFTDPYHLEKKQVW